VVTAVSRDMVLAMAKRSDMAVFEGLAAVRIRYMP
jgi:hypothetical protein